MRYLNRYLVLALFVVAVVSSSSFINDNSCLAAMKKCQACKNVHDSQIGCKDTRVKLCTDCGKVHDSIVSCKDAARIAQGEGKGGGETRGKGATFKAAFVGSGASKVGNLTAGLSLIQSQAANMISANFTPYTYGYGGYSK